MAKRTKDTQKDWFYIGAYPTAEQFHDVIDSTLGVLDSTSELPAAGAGNLGNEYKVGNTFYKCEQVNGVYQWVPKATATPTDDYNDLANKPTINNVRISGDIEDIDELGALSRNTDKYNAAQAADLAATSLVYIKGANGWVKTNLGDLVAALNLVNTTALETFRTTVLAAAAEQTAESLAGKLDKDLGNLAVVSSLSGEDFVLIVTSDGPRIVKIDRLSDNVAVRTVSTRVLESSINNQLEKLTVSGAKNGVNVDYTVAEAYVAGTQMLFLNGQLLTHNTDYKVSPSGFTMLSYTPVAQDELIFMGVPK